MVKEGIKIAGGEDRLAHCVSKETRQDERCNVYLRIEKER